MNKNIALVFAGLATGIVCMTLWRPARAGTKANYEVIVNTTTRHAEGSVGSARNSSDGVQYLYCSIQIGFNFPNSYQIACGARDSVGHTVSCTHTSGGNELYIDALFAAASSVSGDSYVSFDADTAGDCRNLYVENGSPEAPKAPPP